MSANEPTEQSIVPSVTFNRFSSYATRHEMTMGKRERIAAMALQAIVTAGEISPTAAANRAVEYADALLKRLTP